MSRCLACGKEAVHIELFCGYWCEDSYKMNHHEDYESIRYTNEKEKTIHTN
jgi:arginyl-tRNA--protein-N-Asp/Glu arginylyltransferase